MTLKKSEKRLLVILGIVVAVFLVDQFFLGSGDEDDAVPSPNLAQQNTQVVQSIVSQTGSGQGSVQQSGIISKKYFESWGRDPFSSRQVVAVQARAAQKKAQQSLPELRGFFWKKGRAYVLIDEIILTEGEEKDGLRVERIRDKEVLCSQGNRTFTLHWRESP